MLKSSGRHWKPPPLTPFQHQHWGSCVQIFCNFPKQTGQQPQLCRGEKVNRVWTSLLFHSSHNYFCLFLREQPSISICTIHHVEATKTKSSWREISAVRRRLRWPVFTSPSTVAILNIYKHFYLQTWSNTTSYDLVSTEPFVVDLLAFC